MFRLNPDNSKDSIPFCHKYVHQILTQNNSGFCDKFGCFMYRDNSGFIVGWVRALVETMLKMPKSLITFMIGEISPYMLITWKGQNYDFCQVKTGQCHNMKPLSLPPLKPLTEFHLKRESLPQGVIIATKPLDVNDNCTQRPF